MHPWLRLLGKPWFVAATVALVVLTTVETVLGNGALGVLAAVTGALLGTIVLPMCTRTGLLLGSFLLGLRVRHIVIGAGRRLGTVRAGQVEVTFRTLPVVLSADIGPRREPVITRCWTAGLVSALFGVAVATAGWFGLGTPFWDGFAPAASAVLLYQLIPGRTPLRTSTGWLLFGLPRQDAGRAREFRAGAYAAEAHTLLQRGELDRARAVVDELDRIAPDSHTALSCRVTMHEARGEFDTATMLLLGRLSEQQPPRREMCYMLAGLAGLGLAAAEAGQLPAADIVPTAERALHDSVRLGFPAFELSGTFGLLALSQGETAEAVRLCGTGAEYSTSTTSRADNLATLARAYMAEGENGRARETLADAERLADWWPRVRSVRERLDVVG
ncbi:hypothetical protein SAMN04487819_102207 [Actinopolyspora alba]|uniref:Tetratricopeptide repeat-containing protein n=1 Tax=Actinopolyspora alba TaxID=673379 RepID=A0A1I1UL87_9ACTN|nr:hypothetical protein [Actinopolyspora alba]SFD70398.1 hypothetical protein SAMN04487819_102207 [Actinopolyspora alba]